MFIKSPPFAVSRLSAAILSTLFSQQLFAESANTAADAVEQVPYVETVTVVSSRTPTPLRELGTSISFLDEEQIKARGFTSLADVLRVMPSVAISNAGGMGNPTSLSVRGEQGYRTMVRIDGVDVSDPTVPQTYTQIQHLMSSNIARVELLRGPQGMMYGADAGGVLLVSTPTKKDGFFSELDLEGGSMGEANASGGVGGGNESGNFYLSASHNKIDGFSSSKLDLKQDKDGYENTTVHARGDLNIADNWILQTVVRSTNGNNEYDRCSYPSVDDCRSEFSQQNARVAVVNSSESGSNSLAYSRADIDRTTFAKGKKEFAYGGQINRWEFNGDTRVSETHNFVYGLEHRVDEAEETQRDQNGIYAEYQGRYSNQLFFTAGVRHDDNQDFGAHDSYRVSGAYVAPWVTTGLLKFKTSIGTGFRAPSLYEVEYNRQANVDIQSAPDKLPTLNAEDSKGTDAGVEYYLDSGSRFELTLFNQSISNEIYFDLVNYSGYLQGGQSSKSKGVEVAAEIVLIDRVTLNTNYTYTSTNASGGVPRLRKPKNMANLGVTFKPESALSLSMNVRAASDAIDVDKKPLDNYAVVDASCWYEFSQGQKFYIRGENIFNKQYIEIRNFNTAEASIYAGFNLTF